MESPPPAPLRIVVVGDVSPVLPVWLPFVKVAHVVRSLFKMKCYSFRGDSDYVGGLRIHDFWHPVQDAKALKALKPDLVLFTGDFGDENVEIVKQVSCLDFPKALILGNHDCWFTFTFTNSPIDPVQLQLQSLGDTHVGYKRLDFPNLKLSVVGGRPFSSGGISMSSSSRLISQRYNINSMGKSASRISDMALKAPLDHSLIFLAHNGPTGLGSNYGDICGKDWDLFSCGDHGDPDLEEALKFVKDRGARKVALVVFGHMHKRLCFDRGFRSMLVAGLDETVYLNAAVVPRVRAVEETFNDHSDDNQNEETEHNFSVVEMLNGEVHKISEVWVRVGKEFSGPIEATVLFPVDEGSSSSNSFNVDHYH